MAGTHITNILLKPILYPATKSEGPAERFIHVVKAAEGVEIGAPAARLSLTELVEDYIKIVIERIPPAKVRDARMRAQKKRSSPSMERGHQKSKRHSLE